VRPRSSDLQAQDVGPDVSAYADDGIGGRVGVADAVGDQLAHQQLCIGEHRVAQAPGNPALTAARAAAGASRPATSVTSNGATRSPDVAPGGGASRGDGGRGIWCGRMRDLPRISPTAQRVRGP